jgi:hypothetical protein
VAEESELGRSRKVTTKNSNSTKLISLTRCLASTNLVNLSYHTSRLRMAVRGHLMQVFGFSLNVPMGLIPYSLDER